MPHISKEKWSEVLSNPKKATPEWRAKAKETAEKFKEISLEERLKLEEQATDKSIKVCHRDISL